ncbi:synaptotagmin-like protein 2 [Chanos chanos]|uniref:Synaptotagmin-like protein 2 n=1 Tax=Chanos chanos TaxID=29144 RepID=A0A6J2VLV1_CHACN|nr:synaptotagmin-like protein 2 [Chanos chanos]
MYAVNIDEDQDQELVLQSSKVQSPPPYKKTHEVILTQSRKTQGTNNLQSKRSPEVQGSLSTRRPSRSSEGSGSPQPLARSFIPKDIQHYLGISDNSSTFSTGPVTGESGDFICTSFCTAPEKDPCIMSGPVKASTPLGSEEFSRRGNQGLRTMHKMHDSDDVSQGSSKSSISDTLSHSQARSNWEESPVQKALRRAATRPVFHKSLEDITALPTEATPPSSTSSFSDPSRMKILSKSVPSFLEKESDEEDSGSTSDNSFQSGTPQKIGRSLTNVSNSSGMASVSSTSSSVMSVDSGDFGNVEVQGTIQFTINYVQKLREFHIFIVQCKNLAAVDLKRNRSDPYVKSYLIPDSANLGKRKTAVKKRTLNPSYNEILRYRVRMDYLKTQVLNLSVWHNDTFGRNIFLGEVEIDLSTWDFSTTPMNNLPLKPKTVSSLNASDYRGDLRVAIRFMPQISQTRTVSKMGEVHIWVKECKNLPLIRGTTIDPYVKCCVLPDTSRKSRQKTRVLKRTVNPVFNHTMVYDGFHTEDLKEACVELTVWDHDRLANHLLGGVRLGLGTGKSYGVQVDWMDSTREEVTVWQRMIESPNEWVENVLPLRVVMAAKNAWK